MNREQQIETTDWLTRGIPKEQLEREKREAIMSADLQECITYDEWSAREYGIDSIDFDTMAEKMVTRGYRKQSEGEWVNNHCTKCGMTPIDEEIWEMLDITPPKEEVFMDYCPNCGAKMKGE